MDRIDAGLFLVRVVFGLFLAWHGVNKVRSGISGTASWFASIGMKWPVTQAWTAALTEITGGIMFAAGFLTPLAAASIIGTMLVAVVTVHWKVGFFIFLPNGGWEYCVSIAVLAAAVSLTGAGSVSLDHVVGITPSVALASGGIILGIAGGLVHLIVSYRPGGK